MLASVTQNDNEDIPCLVTDDVATTVVFVLSMPQHVQVQLWKRISITYFITSTLTISLKQRHEQCQISWNSMLISARYDYAKCNMSLKDFYVAI